MPKTGDAERAQKYRALKKIRRISPENNDSLEVGNARKSI